MTTFIVCAVKDRALDAFMQPFFVQTIGVANRSFTDEVNRPESPMYAHPDDYDLHQIGNYDDSTGQITPCAPQQIALGKAVKRQEGVSGA